MKKDIQKALKESDACEEKSPARKTVMLEFLRDFVTKNGHVKSAEFLGVNRVNLTKIVSGKREVTEDLLKKYVKKILENGKKS